MKNLELIRQFCGRYEDLAGASLTCKDYIQKEVYFLKENALYRLSLDAEEVVLFKDLAKDELLQEHVNLGASTVVGLDFIFIDQTLCVGVSAGAIASYSALTGELERSFAVPNGIESVNWSPDQEAGVIVTGKGTIVMVTHDLIPLCEEISLESSEFGEGKPVTVGWGKKETQFHGSQGKAAAKVKAEVTQTAFQWDKRKVHISWRGDGQFFAASSISPETGVRHLRVFSCEGVAQYTSELADGLEDSLSWQPSGSLIATTVRRPNKHEVVFFEKNCLRHGEFTLPFSPQQVKVNKMLWNCDSTILAVWCEDLQTKGDIATSVPANLVSNETFPASPNAYILLWTVNNYHWYLKQSLNFGTSNGDVSQVDWDPENANQLNVICTDGVYLSYTWAWTIDASHGSNGVNSGTVAVIDGYRILVTPFQKVVVPPPMSAYTLNLEKCVNCVVFQQTSSTGDLAVVTEDNTFHLFSTGNSDNSTVNDNSVGDKRSQNQLTKLILRGSCQIPSSDIKQRPLSKHHWTWIDATTILFTETVDRMSRLSIMRVEYDGNMKPSLNHIKDMCLEEILLISPTNKNNIVAVQLFDGSIMKINCDTFDCEPWLKKDGSPLKLPQPCSKMTVVVIDGKDHILTLSETFILMLNGIEVANNCTSYFFSAAYLIYTSYDHTLHCVPACSLNDLFLGSKVVSITEQLRNLERGSSIVTVISSDMKVVLQMPRGNLETIFPRALVLLLIKQHLNSFEYKNAVLLMRKHRINMNLVVDHNKMEFTRHVDLFVTQMEQSDWINVFLLSLQEEDVTTSMYKIAYDSPSGEKNISLGQQPFSKVDFVCDTVLKSMEKIDSKRYILEILTAHAKKTVPELDVALQKIKLIKDKESNGGHSEISVDMALKHLLYLVDVDALYNVALGTYDFELVLMVGEKSQKDPKEYLPLLNELQNLEPDYMKYTIDKHLKKYPSALHHLAKCCIKGDDQHFDEFVSEVKTRELYSQALKEFPKDTKYYRDVAEVYGDFLCGNRNFNEAGLMFIKGEKYEKSLQAFQKSLNWMQAFSVAYKLNYAEEKIIQLARKFAVDLKDNNQFNDAAYVLEIYAKDYEESIAAFVEGRHWDMAWLLINRYQRLDISESHLLPALINRFSNLMSTLATLKITFVQYQRRLLAVREQQKKSKEEQDIENLPDSDLFMDSSTITGFTQATGSNATSSRFTTRTGRNKKKQDRKKVTLKEGSQFEDVALLETLTKIAVQADEIKDECLDLNKALVLHRFDKEAESLQTELESLIRYMVSCKFDIWPTVEKGNNPCEVRLGPLSTSNSITAAFQDQSFTRSIPDDYVQFLTPPTLRNNFDWKLKSLQN